jgi:hypothetical protein
MLYVIYQPKSATEIGRVKIRTPYVIILKNKMKNYDVLDEIKRAKKIRPCDLN